jgi:hypothetical protein
MVPILLSKQLFLRYAVAIMWRFPIDINLANAGTHVPTSIRPRENGGSPLRAGLPADKPGERGGLLFPEGWGFYNKIAISDWTKDPATAAYGNLEFEREMWVGRNSRKVLHTASDVCDEDETESVSAGLQNYQVWNNNSATYKRNMSSFHNVHEDDTIIHDEEGALQEKQAVPTKLKNYKPPTHLLKKFESLQIFNQRVSSEVAISLQFQSMGFEAWRRWEEMERTKVEERDQIRHNILREREEKAREKRRVREEKVYKEVSRVENLVCVVIQSRFRAHLVMQRLRREREAEEKRQEEMRILGEQTQRLKDLASEITGLDQQHVEETRVREASDLSTPVEDTAGDGVVAVEEARQDVGDDNSVRAADRSTVAATDPTTVPPVAPNTTARLKTEKLSKEVSQV